MPQTKRITLLLIFALIFHQGAYARQGDSARRLVSRAQAHLGRGEATGNNAGPDIRRYLQGQEGLSWCAGFISYILEKGGIDELGYSLSAREIYNRARSLCWLAESPKVGDLVVCWRGSPSSWRGHIGLITEVTETKIITIEGNRGPYPAKVSYFEYDKDNIPQLLGFIRIEENDNETPPH